MVYNIHFGIGDENKNFAVEKVFIGEPLASRMGVEYEESEEEKEESSQTQQAEQRQDNSKSFDTSVKDVLFLAQSGGRVRHDGRGEGTEGQHSRGNEVDGESSHAAGEVGVVVQARGVNGGEGAGEVNLEDSDSIELRIVHSSDHSCGLLRV